MFLNLTNLKKNVYSFLRYLFCWLGKIYKDLYSFRVTQVYFDIYFLLGKMYTNLYSFGGGGKVIL